MRIRETIVAAGFLSVTTALAAPREAAAQSTFPAAVQRNTTWNAVSNVTMILGAGIVTLMPRVYYNDPEATVGWKGRWHVSMLAPAMSLTALTLLVDVPIRNAIQGARPGCTVDATTPTPAPNGGCESFGMPSTQSFASWGATGAGTVIFLVDTFKYSNAKFHPGGFVGNLAVPLVLSVITSVGRSVGSAPTQPYETPLQIVAGSVSGFLTGGLLALGYSFLQRPNCGYGNNLICW